MFALSKGADINWLVQGGQQYRAFPFVLRKGSLVEATAYVPVV